MQGAKNRNTGRLRLKKNRGSVRQAWLDWSYWYGGGQRNSKCVAILERVFVCACEVGRSPGQLCEPVYIRVHECLVLLCVCGLRPADPRKPGAPVTAGSLDSSLRWLASLFRFIPHSQTPAEGEKSFYLPAAAASHSLLLDLSLSQSTPPSVVFLLLSACSLLLPLSLFFSLSLGC